MKKFALMLVLFATLPFCSINSYAQADRNNQQKVHLAVVQEVLQTSNYTYLYVKSDTSLQWLAVPSMTIKVGDTCYFKGGLVMPDFKSKELNKTFDNVIFMESVGKTPEGATKPASGIPEHGAKTKPGKLEVVIEPAPDGISIAELFKNKANYDGKVVKIKGQVVKFKPAIMGKNWVHLQDGSSFGDKFDLTATLNTTLKVGDIVTIESKVTLNKDFGSGYFFEVILEDAVVK